MRSKPYLAPCILSHTNLQFETHVSGCDDNGQGDDIHGHDHDHGLGLCHTSNPKD
ncbi:hypothetical protein [Alicyclobacillus ferrooxydans]|uniref:hypothetical protein n=1 Tax=Alicyclobacillus ferrooxydans TaxID=471514 RepID=UPI0012EDF499|nr:hypothetical protein [Alicyclobacillus ferrooxydans]